jgi:hypothetical protein
MVVRPGKAEGVAGGAPQLGAAGGDDPVARLLDPRREVVAERLADVVDVTRRLIDDVVARSPAVPGELLQVRKRRQAGYRHRDLRLLEPRRLLEKALHSDGGG